ncbi:MAG: cation diffusion facilitator family transporter [Clostridium sp.]|nr:cation diffusion facilitator family transporter [Clostridium sp.]
MQEQERAQSIYRVTLAGSAVNLLLVVFKLVAGVFGHSAAMVADAVHSLSDLATDVVVLLFVRIAGQPQDKHHDYGHGKFETLATAIIGVALLAVGAGLCWNGLRAVWEVIHGRSIPRPQMVALWAALVSVVLKEGIYRFTERAGRRLQSQAVVANAWHHRSDALSSVGTALGIGGAIWLGAGWSVLDPLAAVVVSLLVIKVAVGLLRSSVAELTESSLPDEVEDEIEALVCAEPGVCGMHNLRTRRIGNHYAIEMHVRMDGRQTLFEAHDRASRIERALRQRYGVHTHVGIHVEPMKENGKYVAPVAEPSVTATV